MFHTGAAMKIALEQRFRGAEGSIAGALFCVDDAELVRTLSLKARGGVLVRLVLDESQVRKPSCRMQLHRSQRTPINHKSPRGPGLGL